MSKSPVNIDRQTIKISKELYLKARNMVEDSGGTLINYIDRIVLIDLERDNFLKMSFPFLKEDYISDDAIYVKDSSAQKTAIVKLKQHPDTNLDDSGFFTFCETCESDNCIHVRYCLASGSIVQLYTSSKKA